MPGRGSRRLGSLPFESWTKMKNLSSYDDQDAKSLCFGAANDDDADDDNRCDQDAKDLIITNPKLCCAGTQRTCRWSLSLFTRIGR
jgi:hypothetical protein